MTDGYVRPSSPAESARLEQQAALYGGTAFLQPFFHSGVGRILDGGCGTGFVVRHAAALLPNSEIVGLDGDAARTELERTNPDDFLLEITVLAHGRKPPGNQR